jgi:hypothetical protein
VLLSLLYVFAVYVAAVVVVFVLRRWQATILRREQGEHAPGFAVKLTEVRPDVISSPSPGIPGEGWGEGSGENRG